MGKQVNFYLHTKDFESFYEILKKRNAIFLPSLCAENKLTIIEDPLAYGQKNMELVRAEDLRKLEFYELDGVNAGQWAIDRKAPIVDLDNSRNSQELGIIARGRLFFQSDFYDKS